MQETSGDRGSIRRESNWICLFVSFSENDTDTIICLQWKVGHKHKISFFEFLLQSVAQSVKFNYVGVIRSRQPPTFSHNHCLACAAPVSEKHLLVQLGFLQAGASARECVHSAAGWHNQVQLLERRLTSQLPPETTAESSLQAAVWKVDFYTWAQLLPHNLCRITFANNFDQPSVFLHYISIDTAAAKPIED